MKWLRVLESQRMVKKMKKRICLVLDCLCAHRLRDKTAGLINLQHYVIKEKRLSGGTVVIFYTTWCAWWRPCTR